MVQHLTGTPALALAPANASDRRRTIVFSTVLFCVALLSLMVSSKNLGINPFGSSNSHFLYQAQSFLQGRLDIPHFTKEDIILVNGKYYIVYPPFPAFLMIPFVAIFGLGFSDIFFTQVFSAINVVLLFWLLETLRVSGRSRRTPQQNFVLSFFFFFGTINFYLSLGGTMWFSAHILATFCTLSFMLLAFKRHYALSALCLGCAFLTRAPAVVGLPLLVYLILEDQAGTDKLRDLFNQVRMLPWRKLSLALAPLLIAVLVFLARNALAFGSPWETGYSLLIQQLYPDVHYGVVSPHYIWSDLVANFLSFPSFTFRDAFDISPRLDLLRGGIGLSVFATTPLFLFLFFIRNHHPSTLRKVLWFVVVLITALTLVYHAAGWFQFGSRYLFEAYPYAFALLALSEIEFGWRFYLLGVVGIAINFFGAAVFWSTYLAAGLPG
jgi:hypothetical protein